MTTRHRSDRKQWRPALPVILSLIICFNSFSPALANPRIPSSSVPNPPIQSVQSNIEPDSQPATPQHAGPLPGLSDAEELPDRRTANSSTYQVGERQFAALLSAESTHYQDSQGKWQVINPDFQRQGDSFIVPHNSIRSRVGLQAAWISAALGETTFFWEAQTLLARFQDDSTTSLANALETPQASAVLSPDRRVLNYSNGWSDGSLVEQIISASDSLEHRMIFSQAPAAAGKADRLELQATLELQPGASLWLDGSPAGNLPARASSMEVHLTDGSPALSFEPVVGENELKQIIKDKITGSAGRHCFLSDRWRVVIETIRGFSSYPSEELLNFIDSG